MAGRAILGIALGILFAPIIWMLVYADGYTFGADFFGPLIHGNFLSALGMFGYSGIMSTFAPIYGTNHVSLIEGFGSDSLLGIGPYGPGFVFFFISALIAWAILGAWAGAIERSAGRGIGVGAGIWIGWFVIGLLLWFINPTVTMMGFPVQFQMALSGVPTYVAGFIDLLLGQVLTLIVVIVVAAIFGAMTKSEEF